MVYINPVNDEFISLLKEIGRDSTIKVEDFLNLNSLSSTNVDVLLYEILYSSTSTYNSTLEQYIPDEEKINLQVKLIEFALNNGFESTLHFYHYKSFSITVISKLIENNYLNLLDKKSLLKLVFKASSYSWGYNLDEVEIQKQLIKSLITKEININEFSFRELNIENNHISTIKLLLSYGLDPKALSFIDFNKHNPKDVLEVIKGTDIKISVLSFLIALLSNCNQQLSTETAQILLDNLDCSVDEEIIIDNVINNLRNQGLKFKEWIDLFLNDGDFESHFKPALANGGSIIHILTKDKNIELLKFVLENYKHDINALNYFAQTALFFAPNVEIAKILVEHGCNTNIKDSSGNIWISNSPLDVIEYSIVNNLFDKNESQKVAIQYFNKGNYEHAAKLFNSSFDLNIDPVSNIVDSIITGLKNSIEINKYQVLLNIIDKAGITIPHKSKYLLNSHADHHFPEEFDFLYGLIHKLAKHYINLSKEALEKIIGASEELDNSFNTIDFNTLKTKYPDNLELKKIQNDFDAYYQVIGKALNILDNDFALAALTINGLRPPVLEKDIHVYRGMKADLSPEDIDLYFKYGHRAYSIGEYQKILGFHVNQPWNFEEKAKFEFGSTYVSLSAGVAAGFTYNYDQPQKGIVFEIKIPKSAPKICGSPIGMYELAPSTIYGNDILAVYTLEGGKVSNVHKNPYIIGSDKLQFNNNYGDNDHKEYESLGCKELPIITMHGMEKSALYKNYTDFIERYTPEVYAQDNAKLSEDYFSNRNLYQEEFSYGLYGECNLSIECC